MFEFSSIFVSLPGMTSSAFDPFACFWWSQYSCNGAYGFVSVLHQHLLQSNYYVFLPGAVSD